MRVIAVARLALAAGALVGACSGGNELHPPTTGVGTPPVVPPGSIADAAPDAEAGDAEAGAIVCTGPAASTTDVIAIAYAANAPADRGGSIVAGAYDLTAITLYLGADGEDPDAGDGGVVDAGPATRARASIVLGSGTFDSARSDDGGPVVTRNAKQRTDGVELVVDETCPGNASQQIPFTAAGDMLTLHTTMTRFETYTRRP